MNRFPVAASRQSAAGCCSHELRRSAETPLRQGSWLRFTSNFWRCSLTMKRGPPLRPSPPAGGEGGGGGVGWLVRRVLDRFLGRAGGRRALRSAGRRNWRTTCERVKSTNASPSPWGERVGVRASVYSVLFHWHDVATKQVMLNCGLARALRRKQTWAEKLVWGWLRGR